MRIILDPSRHGCHVWFVERNTVKYLQGTIDEICKRIYEFCVHRERDGLRVIETQCVDISIEANGFGVYIKNGLEHYGLKLNLIKFEKDLPI